MSVFGPNHSGDILVGKTYETETSSVNFINSADEDSLQIFQEDGTAVAANQPFQVYQKSASSKAGFEFSEVIDPASIDYVKAVAHSAATDRQLRVEGFDATIRNNCTYEVFIRLYNDGGTLSVENFRMIPAFYVTPGTGTVTTTTILNGLKADLDKTLEKQALDSVFTVTVDTGNGYLIVTGTNTSFVLGKKDGRPVEFDLQATIRDNGSSSTTPGNRYDDLTVATVDAGNPGVGTGVQSANLEWFYKGYKYSRYREQAYPSDFPQVYNVDSSSNYHVIMISYHKERSYVNVEKQHRLLYILVEAADQDGGGAGTQFTAVNALIADLETATGLTIPDLS